MEAGDPPFAARMYCGENQVVNIGFGQYGAVGLPTARPSPSSATFDGFSYLG
jgi:hypothetical protein